jgi:hypothetical protein
MRCGQHGMKKWLTEVLKVLVIAALTAIVTNLITGQPLTGLTRLEGLAQTLFKSTVPAWAFALTLFAALFGLYYFVRHLLRGRRPKGRVHFVPDAHNCGWAQSDTQIEVRAGGTFTYEGSGVLTVLQAFLKGTHPITDMMVQVETSDGLGKTVSVPCLDLSAHIPVRAFINLRLTPALGIWGKSLRTRLVLRDKYNRDYDFEVILPYIGKQ